VLSPLLEQALSSSAINAPATSRFNGSRAHRLRVGKGVEQTEDVRRDAVGVRVDDGLRRNSETPLAVGEHDIGEFGRIDDLPGARRVENLLPVRR